MRLLILVSLFATLVACSDDKGSSESSKPSAPAAEEDRIIPDGPVLEKPSLGTASPTTSPVAKKNQNSGEVSSVVVKSNPITLPDDPNRVQSASSAAAQSSQQSLAVVTSTNKAQDLKERLAILQSAAQHQPYSVYVDSARESLVSTAESFVTSETEYCLVKYSLQAPTNTSICYYKLGMGSQEEFTLFLELRDELKQQMIASGYIKIIDQEEDYCDTNYKTVMPSSQTRCYFIMGYGTTEEFVAFNQTAEKLDAERKTAGTKKLESLARQYRESKK